LGNPEDGRENTAFFVLDSLLKSRVECGFESDGQPFDESVNVYLVHLLSSLVGSPGLGSFAIKRDADVFDKVRRSTDPRFKCEVYRTSADHLLVSTGIFGDTPFVERDGQRFFEDAAQLRIGRGKAYYHYAASFHGRTGHQSTAVPEILSLLSRDFERYVEVLFHMRGEYFHLFERFREDQLMKIHDEGTRPASGSMDVPTLRDDFLDAYWIWQNGPDEATRETLLNAVKRLQAVDPLFDFQFPGN
jgi:hypothetical protein